MILTFLGQVSLFARRGAPQCTYVYLGNNQFFCSLSIKIYKRKVNELLELCCLSDRALAKETRFVA